MAEQTAVRAAVEQPVLFPGGREQLFGVLTAPGGTSRGIGVIVLTGGAYIAAPNRNRLSVRLTRRLATDGFHAFRFDYHGVGESTGAIEGYWLDRPFVQDLEAAVEVLRAEGLHRLMLIGSCFGARTILATAERVPELAGVVLISTPIRDFEMGDNLPTRYAREMSLAQLLRRAARPQVLLNLFAPRTREAHLRSRHIYTRTAALKIRMIVGRLLGGRSIADGDGRWSENFAEPFRRLVERGVPILLLYGEESFYEEFARVRQGPLRAVFEGARAPLEVDTVSGVLHGFTTLAVQEAVLEKTAAWVRRIAAT